MLRWPKRALAAIEKLFEPLQDIDIYVEDADDEVFYSHLLHHVLKDDVTVVRVFAKGGRLKVIEAAGNHVATPRKTLYLIDGDLEWVRGEHPPIIARLFRLPAYCIENLIISESPVVRLVIEEATLLEEDAAAAVEFDQWVQKIQQPLIELFAAFAVAQKCAPTLPTVSRGVGRLLTTSSGIPELDVAKVAIARDEALAASAAIEGQTVVAQLYQEILDRAHALPFPLDIVSGKDYLLPLLDFHLRNYECKLRRKTLRTRLALHSDRSRFEALRHAIMSS